MTDIEREARLLCKANGQNPDKELRVSREYMWRAYALQAEGLAEAGLVIRPLEPTEEMLSADVSGQWEWTGDFNKAARTQTWQAMNAAYKP